MLDQIRTLLLNPTDAIGYTHVDDAASDVALGLLAGDNAVDAAFVDKVLPFALAPDLAWARSAFDSRVTPQFTLSVYRDDDMGIDLSGAYTRALTGDGRWKTARVFEYSDPAVYAVLRGLRAAALSLDAAYAVGAVLVACAYRRLILQGGDNSG